MQKRVDMNSDWSDSDDGKDNQVRKRPIQHDIPSDLQTETEDQETIVGTPFRRPNTMPKVVTCRKGKCPLANWTSVAKRQGNNSGNDGHDISSTSIPRRDTHAERNSTEMAPINRSQTYPAVLPPCKSRK